MLEKDEYGYVLKIVSNFPYHPWWRLTAQLVEGFRDKKKTGLVSSVGIYSPKFGLGSFENPKMIGKGEVDAGIINPTEVTAYAGLSLGEYTALHLGGAFSFEDGLKLVAARGKYMQEAAVATPSGMVAILGADATEIGRAHV